jgi:DNA-binding transcriptional MerR regulator
VNEESGSADRLMSIGAFARRSRLSMKALRLYDRQGLLSPAHVDPANGYRWYRESQLFTARLIVLLRQIDMPLAHVAELVAAPGEKSAELLDAYWNDVERRISGQRQLVGLLRTSLSGGEERFGDFRIQERTVPDQLVLSEQRQLRLDEMEPWLRTTKRRLTELARQAYGGPAGGLFVVFHGEVSQDSDGPVEVCVPVGAQNEGAAAPDGTVLRAEPAHREAYARITKAQFEVPQILSVYEAVERWTAAAGRTVIDSPREIYFPDVDPHTARPGDDVCDIAYPVR